MKSAILLIALLPMMGCGYTTQTTSGAAFVAATDAGRQRPIDADIAKLASVEPHLVFPARIGVVRIVNGAIDAFPADEAALLGDLSQRNQSLGTLFPVSPLISALVNGEPKRGERSSVINDIRRTAARQHLDYVLVYEIGARSREADSPFALADVTLIGGALLPTRNIRIAGIGQALFVDVRNGYPYGTAQTAQDLSGLGRSFGTSRRTEALRAKAISKTAAALFREVEKMLADLAAKSRH